MVFRVRRHMVRHPRPLCSVALVLLLLLGSTPAAAQFLPFGRNKIAHTQFDWQILRTEHFDIYHYPEMEDLARRGATFAERSFSKLERDFNFTVTHRIPLIFYSSPIHFQQTNTTPGFIPDGVGGFFEFLKGRVVIPASGSLEQFRHVINHELAHVFMHTKIDHTLRQHGMRADRYPPLWFVEGLAEFFSTEWDSQAEMLMRDAVLNGYFAPISTIWSIGGTFLMYKEGQNALLFMEQEYGREKIVQILDNMWKADAFSEVMRLTIGVDYEGFDRAWARYLRRRYFPLAAALDSPSDVTIPVVPQGFNSKPVYYRSGDSAYVVYMANNTGYAGVYRRSLSGGETVQLIQGEKSEEYEAFHLFQSRMSINGDHVLAFVTKSGESDVLHLYDLDEDVLRETFSFDGIVMIGSPSWSPDGRRIAFSALNTAGENDLYILHVEREELEKLTADVYDDRDPAWSPGGDLLAFISDRGAYGAQGYRNLFLYDLGSGDMRSLAQDTSNFASPAWSPDGRYVACTNDRRGVDDLCLLAPDSAGTPVTSIRRVSNFLTSAADPSWTERGGLVFTAFDAFSFQVRALKDVAARADSFETVPLPPFRPATSRWDVPRLEGLSLQTRLDYEREYQLDIAQSAISTSPVYGTIGGASLSMSDMLGDDRYTFLVYNTAQSSSEILTSFNLAVVRSELGRRNPLSYGVFSASGRRYDFLDPDVYFYERAYGGFFSAAYPLSKFTRLEGSVSLSNTNREGIASVLHRKSLLLTNTVSFVKDNALYYYTGPIDGHRFNVTLGYTSDIQYSNVSYYSLMFDYRKYVRIGLRSTLASRVELLYNDGLNARRYFLGGSWDLRGWDRWSIRGTKRWLFSTELRFPLLDRVGFDFPFGAFYFGILRGALFFDAGNAWDDKYVYTLGSLGGGLRLNLFNIIVLRWDIGKRIEKDFTRLQHDWFSQFFFGWDF